MKLDDEIDRSVAVRLRKKTGDAVSVGDTVIEVLYNDDARLAEAMKYLTDCWAVSENAERRELILDYVFGRMCENPLTYLLFFIARASLVTAMPPSEVQRSSQGSIRPLAHTASTVQSMPTGL